MGKFYKISWKCLYKISRRTNSISFKNIKFPKISVITLHLKRKSRKEFNFTFSRNRLFSQVMVGRFFGEIFKYKISGKYIKYPKYRAFYTIVIVVKKKFDTAENEWI